MSNNDNPEPEISRLFSILVGSIALGACLLVVAGVLFFLSPAKETDRTRIAELIATSTATYTTTPTNTSTSTLTPTSTDTPTLTPTPTTSPTLLPTPTYTPTMTSTPLPISDGRERDFWVPILMYHYVSVPPEDADVYRLDLSVSPSNFREQMQWLADEGYETISVTDLAYALNIGWPPLPEKPIILTFDDGYVDNYEEAFPILEEFGFTGTFFILTDVTDRSEPGYMTWDMLREMYEAGNSIEVHGREHHDMADRDPDWLLFHLLGPAQTIEATIGYRPHILSYPAGSYDSNVIQAAYQHGYWAAVTTRNGSQHFSDEIFELRRLRVRGDWTIDIFKAVVSEAS